MSIKKIKVPVLPESVTEATLLNWYKQPGEAVTEGEKLVEIETDKVILEVVASHSGVLSDMIKNNGENVQGDEVIAHIDTTASATVSTSVTSTTQPDSTSAIPLEIASPQQSTAPPKTGPAVRKMVAEQGIDLTTVPHQGDRVTKADLLQQPLQMMPTIQEKTESSNEDLLSRPEQRVPMTRLRKRVAERLLNAQHQSAILTTFNEVNMKAVIDLRNQYKAHFDKKHGIKLGFMSFFAKAAVMALQKFPIVNASIEQEDIIYHGYYDIGIAVSTPRGLVVPILRDADMLSFADIEAGIADFAKRARDNQLTLEELTGGTFSITNGGIFGSMLSTPILNPPQSAILGMHNIVERPIVEQSQIVIRPIMYLALSYDHRLVDGRDAVQFLVTIKNAIEDPNRLLLDI